MRKPYATIVASLFFVLPAVSQSGSIRSGSTTFGWAGTAAANCSSVNHLNNFTATGTDHLYEHFWALCVDNDPMACRLYAPTQSDVGTSPAGGAVARVQYDNFEMKDLDILWHVSVNEISPGVGNAVSRLTIRNIGTSPRTLQLFAYFDFDVCGGTQNTAVGTTTPDGFVHTLVGGACNAVEVFALGADADQVAPFASIRGQILGGCPDYTSAPFSPGGMFGPADYTSAFQWKDRTIMPLQTIEVYTVSTDGGMHVPCTAPALAQPYGASSGGAAQLVSFTAPVRGSVAEARVGGGLAMAPGVLFLDFQMQNVPISGLTLLAFPQASIDMPLDANGQALIALPVPYQTFFCNASLFM